MSLKIEFSTDIQGFERVERALNMQKQLLNETAQSIESVNRAKADMNKMDLQVKSSETLKTTAREIKDLAGSLDLLTRSQSGLKGFMSSFTEFGRGMKELTGEMSAQVISNLVNKLNSIKAEISSTTDLIGKKKEEMQLYRGDKTTKEYLQMQTELNQARVQQFALSQMRQEGQFVLTKAAPQVAATTGNFALGGLMAGMAGVAGSVGTGLAVTAAAMKGIEKIEDITVEGAIRGKQIELMREYNISRQAMGGKIGRMYMLSQGFGEEAEWMESRGIRDREGNITLKQVGRHTRGYLDYLTHGGLTGSLSALLNKATFGAAGDMTGHYDAIRAMKAKQSERYAEEMKMQNELLDMGGEMAKRRASLIDPLGRRIGSEAANRLLSQTGRGISDLQYSGLGMEAAAPQLLLAERYGLTERLQGGRPEGAGLMGDPRFLLYARQRMGLSQLAESELMRGAYYRPNAPTEFGRLMGGAGVRNIAARELLSDFAAQQTSQIFGGAFGGFEEVGRFAAGVSGKIGAQYTPEEQVKGGIQAQQLFQGAIGAQGTLMSLGVESSLIEMGVTSPFDRGTVRDLLSKGLQDEAVQFINTISGGKFDKKTIRSKLGQAKTTLQETVTQMVGGEDPTRRAAYKSIGRSAEGVALTGSTTAALSSAGVYEAAARQPLLGPAITKEAGLLAPTEQMKIESALSKFEADIIRDATQATQAVGRTIQTTLVDSVALGFENTANDLRKALYMILQERGGVKPASPDKGAIENKQTQQNFLNTQNKAKGK